MKCPFCGSDNTKVVDSRNHLDGTTIKRRRECENCEKRFTTYEKIGDLSLRVEKKSGFVELYSREKVFNGIMRALEKRSVDMEKVEEILEKIERDILTKYSGLVKSSELGDMTLSYLLDLDEVAYVRFASVYKKFNSLENFLKEIEKINFESGKK
ncbi:Transcriptional repressor NrdR [Sebaldella termitidis]|jgi:transcriptional repressor NrdR|uniref:Transcriptional repressor NrdR n=1 Tax=Sebaldella termitidis (strain ATCC 33386 / NCTC 11300) TaxID=526218 RepID=D1AI49_SEBTE|nr:transcriptional regulator NrdR [Sebaldella termitidis]ACZ08433.1 ATP-cone domain protein [Sebaldella termitidis ATCC 33386]SUI23746.1 Transcriptional repressor NrdR [Sebaldella termitidis]